MAQGGDQLFRQVRRADAKRRGVDAGVDTDVFAAQHICVDQQLHPIVVVVHQAKDAQTSGGDVQKLLHVAAVGKGQAAGADLLAEHAGLEGLVAGHQQNIKIRLLAVAEHQILAHGGTQHIVHGDTGFHGHGGLMVHPLVVDAQAVQQRIDPLLLGQVFCSNQRESRDPFLDSSRIPYLR